MSLANSYTSDAPLPPSALSTITAEYLDSNRSIRDAVTQLLEQYGAYTIAKSGNTAACALRDLRATVQHFVDHPNDDFDAQDPFVLFDMGAPVTQMARFKYNLPRVTPYYAVKCNSRPELLDVMCALGACFDCASIGEIETVLKLGVPADRIIFAHPHKPVRAMRKASKLGVQLTTVDSVSCVHDLAVHMPDSKVLIRITTDDRAAQCAFSAKFGAPLSAAAQILEMAKQVGVRVVGVAFHVGSGNSDTTAYRTALNDARWVFDKGMELGFDMHILDLGGGFPGDDSGAMLFEDIAAAINPLLDTLFPTTSIIAEPGRYFAASTQTVAAAVYSERQSANKVRLPPSQRRLCTDDKTEHHYFVGDGAYHNFNNIIYDHAHPEIHVLNVRDDDLAYVTSIWGPTCDSVDCLLRSQLFPKLSKGDWLFFPTMGAYTTAAATTFNGFANRRVEYISTLTL